MPDLEHCTQCNESFDPAEDDGETSSTGAYTCWLCLKASNARYWRELRAEGMER